MVFFSFVIPQKILRGGRTTWCIIHERPNLCLLNPLCILKPVQEISGIELQFVGGFSFPLGSLQCNFSITKCSTGILQRDFIKVSGVFFTLRCGVDNSWSSSFSSLFTGVVCNSSITFKIKINNLKIKGVHQTRSYICKWVFLVSVSELPSFFKVVWTDQKQSQSIVHES